MDDARYFLRLYRHEGVWCFDHPEMELEAEPFVEGTDVLINALRDRETPEVERPLLMFSTEPFTGGTALHWLETQERMSGPWNLYDCPALASEGWLGPVLLQFFLEPPKSLYARLCDWPNITSPAYRILRGGSESSERSFSGSL